MGQAKDNPCCLVNSDDWCDLAKDLPVWYQFSLAPGPFGSGPEGGVKLVLKLELKQNMIETSPDLTRFFAWARERAYTEFERLMAEDPTRDPNWTFSDIMQRLYHEYHPPSRVGVGEDEAVQL